MLIMSTGLSLAVFTVFLTLEITEIVLFIGNFAGNASVVKVGGVIGGITAVAAWYALRRRGCLQRHGGQQDQAAGGARPPAATGLSLQMCRPRAGNR